MEHRFDVIIVGGGHAGCEAAAAACRLGARTLLATMSIAQLGAMSCNPAIGGVGKGHLVREVDAFDGLIALAADEAAVHYRMLNRSKGPAVWGPRVQADRVRFAQAIQRRLRAEAQLAVAQLEIVGLVTTGGNVTGIVAADGSSYTAKSVVLATGTFLRAVLHRGEESWSGGRIAERAAGPLGVQLGALGLPLSRLKTGTPPRLDGRTIDWSRLPRQPSDREAWTFSPLSRGPRLPQLACFITRTNPRSHDLIRDGMARSPLRSGAIEGKGPRYCPSIEDKVERFGDRDGHQLFLEPEGLDVTTVYPNGISTCLPGEVQQAVIQTISGLEQARIVASGYAVEYDHVDPRILEHTLETRDIPGLFLAGQINGTTGYEEASAQGLVAGLNAAATALGRPPITFDRTESYIGVMVDDLCLQGVSEPYRMLTARAEFRLSLRADNAMSRVTAHAERCGAVGPARRAWWSRYQAIRSSMESLDIKSSFAEEDRPILDQVKTEAANDLRYGPYVERQRREWDRISHDHEVAIPSGLDFRSVPGLSTEMIDRLERTRPRTIGELGRVSGVTPAGVAALLVQCRACR